jgi:hypothetical protein
MKTFKWFGMQADIERVLGGWLEIPGIRLVAPDARDGMPVFFDSLCAELWGVLQRTSHLHIAGPFTVDIQLSPQRVFVVEYSGPLLYFRLPTVSFGDKLWMLPDLPANPRRPAQLNAGFLGLHSTYYFSQPVDHSTYLAVGEYYVRLVQSAKDSLTRSNKRWVGAGALRAVAAGIAVVDRKA